MTADQVQIVQATIADAPCILEIQKKAFQIEALLYGRDDLPPLMQSLDAFLKEFSSYDYLKAICENQIVGSVRASVNGHTCFIGRLIVLPAYQKRGIGSKLMDCLEDKYKTVQRFELFTGKKSMDNIRLYTRRGYSIYEEFTASGNIALVKMEKANR